MGDLDFLEESCVQWFVLWKDLNCKHGKKKNQPHEAYIET